MLYGIISGATSGASANIILGTANLGLTGSVILGVGTSKQSNAGSLGLSSTAPTRLIVNLSPNLVPAARSLGLSAAAPTAGSWILAAGIWNDSGIWIDTAVWVD
jgi:hypothetical protein